MEKKVPAIIHLPAQMNLPVQKKDPVHHHAQRQPHPVPKKVHVLHHIPRNPILSPVPLKVPVPLLHRYARPVRLKRNPLHLSSVKSAMDKFKLRRCRVLHPFVHRRLRRRSFLRISLRLPRRLLRLLRRRRRRLRSPVNLRGLLGGRWFILGWWEWLSVSWLRR